MAGKECAVMGVFFIRCWICEVVLEFAASRYVSVRF
jgi:hypothetical protein